MTWKGNAPMPPCNRAQQQEILDIIATFRGKNRTAAEELVEEMTPKGLCTVLHATRRWYSYNCWNAAKKIIPYREELSTVMDLDAPVGTAYRGFKVDVDSDLADVSVGDVIHLPVTRNGGCTSWSLKKDITNRFSGKSKGKIGLIIRLADARGVKPFIAPTTKTESWFNRLYSETMGESFRPNEAEYAIYCKRLLVEIIAVKR